jgi:hypothetical protein
MRRSNVTLRLQSSLLEEAKRVAEKEGVAPTIIFANEQNAVMSRERNAC